MIRKEMIAMLLAGGQESHLGVITETIVKPAVTFGGKYRIIDFPLSNCINSGIDTVGVITEVSPNASKVQLILDPRSSVGTLVQRPESRVAGIVQGNPSDPMLPQMINIPRNADVIEGDVIVTSGFGGVYPKGLLIGSVANIQNDDGGLLEIAYLYTAVDFQKLEDVLIITASREAPPEPLTAPKQTPGTETDKDGNPIGGDGK